MAFGKRWAFYAPDIFEGQWWRAVSYLFVHAGALHLLMNMGGLWVLGPFVERAFGRLRYAAIYLISGFTGSAVYLILTRLGVIQPDELVGASGCIMGLLAPRVRSCCALGFGNEPPWHDRSSSAAAGSRAAGLLRSNDATSRSLAHALGLLGGFVSALLFAKS